MIQGNVSFTDVDKSVLSISVQFFHLQLRNIIKREYTNDNSGIRETPKTPKGTKDGQQSKNKVF